MTIGDAWPDHLLDLDEWGALDEDTSRHIELVEGVLVVSPRAAALHQRIAMRLATALDGTVDPAWRAVPDVELVVDAGPTPTVRAPDVVVLRAEAVDERPRQVPSDVLAVVEILSPGSRRTDRVTKVADYADAGVTHYLVVDPGPPLVLTELVLTDGAYRHVADHTGTADLTLGVRIDLDELPR